MKMRLEDCIVTTIDNRGRNPQAYFSQGKYPVIDNFLIKNTLHPDLSAATRFIDEETFRNFLRGYVHKDMPIMTLVGNGIGNVSLAPSDNCAIIQNTIGFLVNENIDQTFLYYYFLYEQDRIRKFDRGSGQPSIRKTDILAMEIDIPNKETQKKIAAILRGLDEKIESNNRINDNLLQQLRAIFMERFTNNPALESIQQVPLSELCSVVTKGTTPTTLGKPFVDRGINFLKAESILDNHSLDKGKFAHIDEETHDMLKRSVIYAGDIVFTIAGTLGRFALIDSDILPANTNQAVAIIRADKGRISPEYLYACFIGNWHNDYYSKRVQQAVQANLSLTTIKSLPIPVLTQDEMVSYMALISPIIRMLKQNEMENERLAALRDTLLPRLMSGEVDVTDIEI